MANVQVHAEVAAYGMVVDPGCMKHMDCISVCPNDALYFGFGKPAVAVKKSGAKNYSLTGTGARGRVIFFVAFLAVWALPACSDVMAIDAMSRRFRDAHGD